MTDDGMRPGTVDAQGNPLPSNLFEARARLMAMHMGSPEWERLSVEVEEMKTNALRIAKEGGDIEYWLREYCEAARGRRNED